MFYVYAHYVDNKPVYIGKGKGKRHLDKRDYDDHTSEILYNNIDEYTALELEKWLINLIGIDNLRNKVTWNAISADRNIYAKATHSNIKQIYQRAEEGDMKAILFLLKKADKFWTTALKNKYLTYGNN